MRTDIRDRNSKLTPVTMTSVTATSDGLTTGIIGQNATFVNVSSTDDAHIVVLPAPKEEMLGKTIMIVRGITKAFELRSSAPATIAINNVTGAGVELLCAASTVSYATLTTMTDWDVVTIAGTFTALTYGVPN